jgi:hypothetical protein
VEFFKDWHLNEVTVVVLSHVIIHCKNYKLMEMMKTIYVHIFVGVILSYLASILIAVLGSIGLVGGFAN